ncbi:EAL domain-containing protein [Acidithiobacillus ferrooxidans]|uniref:EAL domain-containing protein n=1 Tax=Acidithiobacillus ferrooxidans TaxID=920 RepID=UPI0027E07C63|nr:EAL domain-containing protein [Acidithiobacillus ferrooxidans]
MTASPTALECAPLGTFSAQDTLHLRCFGDSLGPRLSHLAEDLYRQLQSQSDTRNVLSDANQAGRLQAMQNEWLKNLFICQYDTAFWDTQRTMGERYIELAIPLSQIWATFTFLRAVLVGEAIRAAMVEQTDPAAWINALLHLLDTCQFVMSMAYERKRLHDAILALRQLARIYDLEEFFHEAARLAITVAQADGAGLLCQGDGQLKYRFFHGLPVAYQAFAKWSFPDHLGTSGAAVQRKEAIYVSDYPQSVYAMPEFVDAGLQGSLAIPVPGPEGIQGVLAISWFQSRPQARIPEDRWDHLRLITDMLGANLYRERLENRMEGLATQDMLTGLPNRRAAMACITTAMARAERHQFLFALLFLDLDGFKPINDRLGHHAGDETLQQVAHDLRNALRGEDSVLRYAGDEFMVLVQDIAHINEIEVIAQRMVETVRRDVQKGNLTLPLSASIGVSVYPFDDGGAEELVHHADLAMYAAKQEGGDQWQFYDDDIGQVLAERQCLVHDLHHALGRGEFVLHWQPIVTLSNRHISGAEALLRWQHPTRGLLSPGDFLEILESLPLMQTVGHWIIETAFAQAAQWHSQGRCIDVHINLAATQLEDLELLDFLRKKLCHYPAIHHEYIWLEIVERVALRDIPATAAMIRACRELGLHFALDDFGTGAAALQYLVELECSGIKLDKSMVEPMRDSPKHHNIVRAMVDMAKALSIHVVAEGVEDNHTAEILDALGVQHAQGYLFAKPMDAAEMTRILG